jgi:hypothetical protein
MKHLSVAIAFLSISTSSALSEDARNIIDPSSEHLHSGNDAIPIGWVSRADLNCPEGTQEPCKINKLGGQAADVRSLPHSEHLVGSILNGTDVVVIEISDPTFRVAKSRWFYIGISNAGNCTASNIDGDVKRVCAGGK